MTDEDQMRQIVVEEMTRNGFDIEGYYIFVCYLESKTVGVVGDNRSYGRVVLVEIRNIYTEAVVQMPMDILSTISNRITNEIREPNKVVYDITHFNGK